MQTSVDKWTHKHSLISLLSSRLLRWSVTIIIVCGRDGGAGEGGSHFDTPRSSSTSYPLVHAIALPFLYSINLATDRVEMAGSSIFDYVHPEDHSELTEYLDMCLVSAPTTSSAGSGSDDGSQPPTPRPGSPADRSELILHTRPLMQ
ncbi:neuronal pas domain-containing protein 3 [Plakobranchus ocellatus]|uniref:Neuronal pas domain-containing protein 3 n=1 Tax=Plakobranchus ocellatus TaxID=259542 RepID=A0AAV3ZY83_9GAST|nr:neuronal pas domain-containing protein 3 [Plakobranchus ocellatus]